MVFSLSRSKNHYIKDHLTPFKGGRKKLGDMSPKLWPHPSPHSTKKKNIDFFHKYFIRT